MILKCRDCYITGALEDPEKALSTALNKIKRFEENGFLPAGRNDIAPIPINLPFDWAYGPEKDPNWRMQCHAWRMLDPYFVAYEISEDKKYIDLILEYVSDWWHWVEFRAVNLGRAWYDMSVGLRACKIALLYQWLNDKKKYRSRVRLVESLALAHFSNLSNEKNINFGNHGIFQSHGLMCLAKSGSLNKALSKVAKGYSESYISEIFNKQFDSEGVHQEGSFEYQRFAIDKFEILISSPVWDASVSLDFPRVLKKAKEVYYWMVFPNGYEVPFGDSDGKYVGVIDKSFYDRKVWISSLGYHVYKCQGDEGSDQDYLLFNLDAGHRIHGHDDFLSIILWSNDKSLLLDAGKYGYVKNRFREYFVSECAHNTARIRGANYNESSCIIEEAIFQELDDGVYSKVCLKLINKNGKTFNQSREFYMRSGECLFVRDSFFSEDLEHLDVSWHCDVGTKNINSKELLGFSSLIFDISSQSEKLPYIESVMDEVELSGLSSVGGGYKSLLPCKTLSFSVSGRLNKVDSFFFFNRQGSSVSQDDLLRDFQERKELFSGKMVS